MKGVDGNPGTQWAKAGPIGPLPLDSHLTIFSGLLNRRAEAGPGPRM